METYELPRDILSSNLDIPSELINFSNEFQINGQLSTTPNNTNTNTNTNTNSSTNINSTNFSNTIPLTNSTNTSTFTNRSTSAQNTISSHDKNNGAINNSNNVNTNTNANATTIDELDSLLQSTTNQDTIPEGRVENINDLINVINLL